MDTGEDEVNLECKSGEVSQRREHQAKPDEVNTPLRILVGSLTEMRTRPGSFAYACLTLMVLAPWVISCTVLVPTVRQASRKAG